MANREKLFFVMILLVLVFVIGALAYFVTTGTGGSDGIAPTGEGRSSDAAVRDIKTDIQTAGGIASEETPEKKLLVAGGGTAEENEPAGVTGNGRLTGLVVNEPGYALEGAKVHFVKTGESSFSRRLSLGLLDYKSPKNPWAATGPDGRFRLDNLPGGEKVSLFVDHEDHVVKKVTIGKYDGDRRDLGTIPLEGGGRITGRVKSREDGRPIAGALVKAVGLAGSMTSDNGFIAIFGGDAAPERVRKTETGPDGAFELKGIPEGNAVVSVEHDDFPPAESQKIHVKKGTTTTGVDLVLEKAYSISGTVLDADGKPIDGISVSVNQPVNVELSDLSSLSSSILKQAGSLSRPDGAFEITGIGEGTYKVTAKGKTYIPRSISGVETGTKDLVFTLQKGGIVFGRAFDSETGKGLEDFKLTVVNEGFLPFFTGLVLKGEEAAALIGAGADPRGAYYVEGVGNKPVELRFTAQGYADRTIKNITSSPGARESVDCVLEPEAAVAGVLLSPDGQPLSGGKLVLKKPEKHRPEGMVIKSILIEDGEEPVRMQGAHWRGRATSDSSGKFRIRGVPEGDYVLEADHDNFRKPEPVELSLSAGESKSGIVMKMLAGGAVEGTVFGKDGRPMPGAAVRAKKVGGAPWSFEAESATADAGGKYAFKGLEPGEYSLSIASKESGSALVSIFVAGEEEKDSGSRVLVEENKTVELDLYDIPAGTVYGSVTEAGRGVPGIEVQIFSTEGFAFMPVKSCRTDDDGRYIMKEIKKGTYRVQLNLGGVPEPFEKEITLHPGGQTAQNFELPTGRVAGRVTDVATGAPIAGVKVSMKRPVEKGKTEKRTVTSIVSMSASTDGEGNEGLTTFTIKGGGSVQTDAEGRFEIPFIKEGEYRLVASGSGYIKKELQPVKVTEGSVTSGQDLKLTKGAVIAGKVINLRTGKTVSHCPLLCTKLGDSGQVEGEPKFTLSERDGSFKVTGLTEGRYQVSCTGGQYEGMLDIRIKPGESTEADIEVTPSS